MTRRKRAAAPASDPRESTPAAAEDAPSLAARVDRQELLVAAAIALVAAGVYVSGRLEFSNIDEYNGRAFADGFLGQVRAYLSADLTAGRFRPLYWVLQGAVTAITGQSATVLMLGRIAFLAAGAWFQFRLSRRLGATRGIAALLTFALAWALPAIAIWTPGGPAEAFGNPLALAFTWLALTAASARGVGVAVLVGLLAALTKESYGAWTAAGLGALVIAEVARGRRGATLWTAAGGAVVQLVPALVASQGPKQLTGSYLGYVVHSISGPPEVVWRVLSSQFPLAIVLGGAGLAAIAWRLVRTRVRAWPVEDLLVLAVLGAALVEVFALGLTMPRYHLPVGTGLLLVAARAAAPFADRSRRTVVAATVALAVLVLPGGVRAALAARSAAADRRVDARLRASIADALRVHGAVRIYWYPSMVEQPVGAITHLKRDGLATGEIELQPCVRPHPSEAAMLGAIFAPYATPVSRPAPTIVSTLCPRVGPGTVVETVCGVGLPGLKPGLPSFGCTEKREHARTFPAR